jgi:serine/threonine protein kinase
MATRRSLGDISAAERAAYLDKTCVGEPELRRRVEALLGALERAGGLLKEPVVGRRSGGQSGRGSEDGQPAPKTIVLEAPATEEGPGTLIGRYKLLERIGEGGFGAVYVAEQREPVKRRVALKIIKLGMDTKQVVARFEAERQALALMDHPNIAKVLDAGATATGRPFFALELVRGVRITEYCDQNHLPTEERLRLFIQVCHAIQHAHQKGIIHRDIKPSNILVTLHDGVPVPKVIDFGIAKATQGELTDKTVYTQFQQFIGTPAYMSPEQAEMSGLDIDTRTDIYSLGVLLYELLTGRTPFDQNDLLAAGLDGMRKMIREEEPVRPSTRVSSLQGQERTTTAKRRGADAPRLAHLLRGDLDWIAMKALEKDRTRRYATANALAMDVERHLRNEPVAARPPSNFYRFQKTLRRNKLAFAAVGATATALLLGAVVSVWQTVRARQAEAAALQEEAAATAAWRQAEAINRFLTEDLLFQATPDQNARDKHITMEEVLGRAAGNLDKNTEVANQPETEATLRLAVGTTYYKLGLSAQAEPQLERAVALRRSALGLLNPATLAAQQALVELLTLPLRRFEEAETLSRETWEGRKRVLGPEHRDTLDTLSAYIVALGHQGKAEQAEPLARQALEMSERVLGLDDHQTLVALGNIAFVLANRGDFAQAEHYQREAVTRSQRLGHVEPEMEFDDRSSLGAYILFQGRLEEAEKVLKEALPAAVRVLGADHYQTLHLQHMLARVLDEAGRLQEAEDLARKTLAARLRATPGQEGTGRTLLILGRVLVKEGKPDEAEGFLRDARALFRDRYPKKPELAAQAENWLGAIQLARRAYTEAEGLLLPNSEHLFNTGITAHERRDLIEHIIKLYDDSARPEAASRWQRRLKEADKTGGEKTSSSKLSNPESLRSKAPEKLQTASTNHTQSTLEFAAWDLVFLWSLEFEAWSLPFYG